MSQSNRVTTVKIPADLLKVISEVPDSRSAVDWSPELDAAILEYYPVKHKAKLARALGMSEDRLRTRYRELTEGE